jgi:hypothetical protein
MYPIDDFNLNKKISDYLYGSIKFRRKLNLYLQKTLGYLYANNSDK